MNKLEPKDKARSILNNAFLEMDLIFQQRKFDTQDMNSFLWECLTITQSKVEEIKKLMENNSKRK